MGKFLGQPSPHRSECWNDPLQLLVHSFMILRVGDLLENLSPQGALGILLKSAPELGR